MGIDVYNNLSKEDKQAVNKDIKKEHKHCHWARCNTKGDLDKSGKKGKTSKNGKKSALYKASRGSSPLRNTRTTRVQSALPDIPKPQSHYQLQRAQSISDHRKSYQQDELRRSY